MTRGLLDNDNQDLSFAQLLMSENPQNPPQLHFYLLKPAFLGRCSKGSEQPARCKHRVGSARDQSQGRRQSCFSPLCPCRVDAKPSAALLQLHGSLDPSCPPAVCGEGPFPGPPAAVTERPWASWHGASEPVGLHLGSSSESCWAARPASPLWATPKGFPGPSPKATPTNPILCLLRPNGQNLARLKLLPSKIDSTVWLPWISFFLPIQFWPGQSLVLGPPLEWGGGLFLGNCDAETPPPFSPSP